MITVPQLAAFDPGSWQASAEWARYQAKDAIQAEQELTVQAAQIDQSWPDIVGALASAHLRALAASHGELATDYDDGAAVIEDCAGRVTELSTGIKGVQSLVAADPRVSGPDDQGFVRPTMPFSLPQIVQFLKVLTYARQLTNDGRQMLIEADNRDREGTIQLLALIGIDLPPSDDGPIDLSDDGILLQADLNAQHSYGDCTTLSTLISLAHSNPDFIREHVKWDPATGTYQVTIYDDGKPVTVSVDPDQLPAPGSSQVTSNKPSWLTLYEQAIQQHFGDVNHGQFEDVPIELITGKDVHLGPPPSPDDIRNGINQHPPAIITADTANAPEQPDDIDPSKRVVHGHTYAVRGIDADGNIVLQNPWGPGGGFIDGKYYPGEVHLSPEEYQKYFSNGAVLNPPY